MLAVLVAHVAAENYKAKQRSDSYGNGHHSGEVQYDTRRPKHDGVAYSGESFGSASYGGAAAHGGGGDVYGGAGHGSASYSDPYGTAAYDDVYEVIL